MAIKLPRITIQNGDFVMIDITWNPDRQDLDGVVHVLNEAGVLKVEEPPTSP